MNNQNFYQNNKKYTDFLDSQNDRTIDKIRSYAMIYSGRSKSYSLHSLSQNTKIV